MLIETVKIILCLCQVEIKRLSEPYDECVDTSSGAHDYTRNVYEEIYPETLYSLDVILSHCAILYSHPSIDRGVDPGGGRS